MGTPTPNSVQEALGRRQTEAGTKALEAGKQPRDSVTRPVSPPASKLSRGDARPGNRCGAGDTGGGGGAS